MLKNLLEKHEITIFGIFVGAVAGVFIHFYMKYFPGEISPNHIHWAEFGSFFGGIFGALFSFSAVIILLRTLYVNKSELKETRKVLEKQNFDSIFFHMLKLQSDLLDGIECVNEDKAQDELLFGRRAIEYIVIEYQIKYLNRKMRGDDTSKDILHLHRDSFDVFLLVWGDSFAHYFRLIYNITLLISSANLTSNEQEKYLGILRSQLSSYEVLFLFYNSLSEVGSSKSMPLFVEMNVFKHLNKSKLLNYYDRSKLEQLDDYDKTGEELYSALIGAIKAEK